MEECAICLEPMKTDVTLLTCLHKFHTICILNHRISYNNDKCPLCREKAKFMNRCNLNYNKDGSISYTPYKIKSVGCCNIM